MSKFASQHHSQPKLTQELRPCSEAVPLGICSQSKLSEPHFCVMIFMAVGNCKREQRGPFWRTHWLDRWGTCYETMGWLCEYRSLDSILEGALEHLTNND